MTKRRVHRAMGRPWWVALAIIGGGCASEVTDEPASTPGELGNGTFRYTCVGRADAYCEVGEYAQTFPEKFALEGHFSMSYVDHEGRALSVEVASSEAISRSADVYTPHQTGYVALWAREGAGEVVDLLHVTVSEIHDAAVYRDDVAIGSLTMEVGETVRLHAEPQDLFAGILAGSLPYAWTLNESTAVALRSVSDDNDIDIEGMSEGSAELTVDVGGVTRTLLVQVGPATSGDSTDTGTDSSGDDSGSGSDTDTDTDTEGSTGSTGDTDTDTEGSSSTGGA